MTEMLRCRKCHVAADGWHTCDDCYETPCECVDYRGIQPEAAVTALDGLGGWRNGEVHADADEILLQSVPQPVRDAYERLTARVNFWYE